MGLTDDIRKACARVAGVARSVRIVEERIEPYAATLPAESPPAPDLGPVLSIACPNILFPYLRESVSSVVVRGGFPPFFLTHLNFEALYQQRLEQQQAGAPARPQ